MNRKPLFLIPVKNQRSNLEEVLNEMVYQLELHGFKVKGKPKDFKKITIKKH